jgi:hypothetical protein
MGECMTPQELLVELRRLGVRLEVEGDRLAYYPKSVVPPELTEALRRQKLHVIASIQMAPQRRLSEDSPHSVATDERCMGELNRREYPIQHFDSGAQGWSAVTGPMGSTSFDDSKRAESTEELVEIDWPEPCPKCSSLEAWESIGGDWRCQHCEPPDTSRRLRAAADRIRRRTPLSLRHPLCTTRPASDTSANETRPKDG